MTVTWRQLWIETADALSQTAGGRPDAANEAPVPIVPLRRPLITGLTFDGTLCGDACRFGWASAGASIRLLLLICFKRSPADLSPSSIAR